MNDSAGLHILMDARVSDPSVFTKDRLSQLFSRLTTALNMQPLGDLQVYEVPVDAQTLERVKATGIFEDEGGISTLLAITTSHMTLHAWPLQKYFALDTFSCKDFDAEEALSIIRDSIGVCSENTLIVHRRKPSEQGVRVVRYFQV